MSFKSFIYSSQIENHRKKAAEYVATYDIESAKTHFRKALLYGSEEAYRDILISHANGFLLNNGFVEAMTEFVNKHYKGAKWITKYQEEAKSVRILNCGKWYNNGCKKLEDGKYEEAEWDLFRAAMIGDRASYRLFCRNVLNGNFREYRIEHIDDDIPWERYDIKGQLDYLKGIEYFEWYKEQSQQMDVTALEELLQKAKGYVESGKNKGVPEASELLDVVNKEIGNFLNKKEQRLLLKQLIEQADQGDVDAQWKLGCKYYEGKDIEKDYTKAFHYWKLLADKGYAVAQNCLGTLYFKGYGVEKNHILSVKYFKLSANQGYVEAQNILGLMYSRGEGVEKDYNQAVYYLELAAKQNHVEALKNLAHLYEKGLGVKRDYTKAIHYYKLSALQGDTSAQNNLGLMYYRGEGVEKDDKMAAQWWLLAAKNGEECALHNLKVLKQRIKEDSWSYVFKSIARQMVSEVAGEVVSSEIEELIDGEWGEFLGDATGDAVKEMIMMEDEKWEDN